MNDNLNETSIQILDSRMPCLVSEESGSKKIRVEKWDWKFRGLKCPEIFEKPSTLP